MDNKEHAIGQIVANLGYPQSETLSSIWEVMVTEQEAIWIASLPATPAQVAASTGQCVDAVSRGLRDLYNRGSSSQNLKGQRSVIRESRMRAY